MKTKLTLAVLVVVLSALLAIQHKEVRHLKHERAILKVRLGDKWSAEDWKYASTEHQR